MMDKEKKLKESGATPIFTGTSINPNETAAASKNSSDVVAVTEGSKTIAAKDNKRETAKTEGEAEAPKEIVKPKPKKTAAKKEK